MNIDILLTEKNINYLKKSIRKHNKNLIEYEDALQICYQRLLENNKQITDEKALLVYAGHTINNMYKEAYYKQEKVKYELTGKNSYIEKKKQYQKEYFKKWREAHPDYRRKYYLEKGA